MQLPNANMISAHCSAEKNKPSTQQSWIMRILIDKERIILLFIYRGHQQQTLLTAGCDHVRYRCYTSIHKYTNS